MKNKNTISVLMVKPGEKPVITEIVSDLESMQGAVGGYIEAIYPFDDNVALICNEDGKVSGQKLNRSLKDENGEIYDIIAGNFFICGLGDENFEDIPQDLTAKYYHMFEHPAAFVKYNNRIIEVPNGKLCREGI